MLIRSTMFGASLLIAAGSALAHADNIAAEGGGYLQSGGNVITTGLDGCLRSGTWSADGQINACEGIEEAAEEVAEVAEVEKAPVAPKSELKLATRSESAFFQYDSAELTDAGDQLINSLLGELAGFESIDAITVVGHTDSRGSDSYNQDLSERRAQTVANLLSASYPDADISASGMGESSPIGDNETDAGRLLNRRVEVTVAGSRMVMN
jgi:OmpA-OmpF porin, OOP family